MIKVTNWDRYHQRIRARQITAGLVWQAYRDLLAEARFERPVRIIELGCGTGHNTLQMLKLYRIEKVTMVDSNPNMLNFARETLGHVDCKKEFILGDLFNFNLSEHYDIVHSQGLLEHFNPEQKRQLIKLHKDLLTAEGFALIMVPTPSLLYRSKRKVLEMLNQWIYPDETPIPKVELRTEIENAGLRVLKLKQYHFTEIGAIAQKRPE